MSALLKSSCTVTEREKREGGGENEALCGEQLDKFNIASNGVGFRV